jgi:hypothetical protein
MFFFFIIHVFIMICFPLHTVYVDLYYVTYIICDCIQTYNIWRDQNFMSLATEL